MRTRRDVLRGMAGTVAGAALAPTALAATGIEVTDVAPKIKMLSGAGGNIVVLVTSRGPVLVDSGSSEPAVGVDVVSTMIELLGPGDSTISALFNTHWHRDQTGLNVQAGVNGAPIIAHAKTRQRLAAGWYVPHEDRYEPPLPSEGVPNRTFYTTESYTFGGERIECGYLLEAHTDGDIYVKLPAENVIAVGDVVSPERDPVLDWFGGGWLGGRVDALKKLLELGDADTRYVPSYGPVIGRAAVQAEHDLMLAIFERMVVNLRLGQTPEDMRAAGVLDGLPRTFEDPAKFLYDAQKGFWAHHNKLMHDIV